MELLPGQLIDQRYRLEAELGTGGFGDVWRAVQLGVDREVAIKFLRTDLSPNAEARFELEAKALGRLNHRGCVMLHDFGTTEGGRPYLVTEYVHGETLKSWASRERSMDELLDVACQLTSSVAHAHRHQIVHRDLKPANVLITRGDDGEMRVKVLDFGVARVAGDRWPDITKTGVVIGTPGYMSPEQLLGGEITERTDLYALGVLFFEMIEGRPPFEAESKRKLAMRHIKEDAPPLTRGPQPMRDLVASLLSRHPDDRPHSARHLYEQICAIEPDGQASAASNLRDEAPTVVAKAVDATQPFQGRSAPSTERTSWKPSFAHAALAALGVVAGSGFVLTWLSISGQDSSGDEPKQRIASALKSTPGVASSARQAAPVPDVGRVDTGVTDDAGRAPLAVPGGTAGCGSPSPPLGLTTVTSMEGLEQERLAVYLPGGYDPSVQHRAILMLHDTLQTPRELLSMTQFDVRAEEEQVVLVLPYDPSLRSTWRNPDSRETFKRAIEVARERLCLDPDQLHIFALGAGGSIVDDEMCAIDGLRSVATSGHRLKPNEAICEEASDIDYLALHNLRGFDPPDGGPDCLGAQRMSIEQHDAALARRNRCGKRRPIKAHKTSQCFEWTGCAAPLFSCEVDGGRPWRGKPAVPCMGKPGDFPYTDTVWDFFFDRPSMFDLHDGGADEE